MGGDDLGTKAIKYAIAAFFIILTVFIAVSVVVVIAGILGVFSEDSLTITSECRNNSAYVFISARGSPVNVKCVVLDKEYFNQTEVYVGNLSNGDEEVCIFKLDKNMADPLRFEVSYNDRVQREVCNWRNYQTFID